MSDKNVPKAKPYQIEGSDFLLQNQAAALFDEQGLGKSKQLIDAIMRAVSEGLLDGAVVVCPNHLKSTWEQEINKHSGERAIIFESGDLGRRRALRFLKKKFYIINYEAISPTLSSLCALLRFRRFALVLDESHRIKSVDAKTTKAIHELRLYSKRRYILTGTPVANTPEDLWSQFFFLDGGITLGDNFGEFKKRYRKGAGFTNLNELRERISVLSLRRLKADKLQLPEKRVIRIPVQLDGRQGEMYDQMRKETYLWVRTMSGEEVLNQAEIIIARLTRLAQLVSNPALVDHSYKEVPAKVRVLDRLVEEYLLQSFDQKLIIWTSFVENVRMLSERYRSKGTCILYGGLSNKERDAEITKFKTNDSKHILIANPSAGREGLTLTEANVAIYLDRTFNLVDYLQSQDRIHRISQKRECNIVLLIAEKSIDEYIEFTLSQKYRLARFTQKDDDAIHPDDLALLKPDLLKALIM